MEPILLGWTCLLGLWTIWLWRETLSAHRRHTKFRAQQGRWLERVERQMREEQKWGRN